VIGDDGLCGVSIDAISNEIRHARSPLSPHARVKGHPILLRFIDKMLHIDPTQRFNSFSKVASEIRDLNHIFKETTYIDFQFPN
jgi:hypothetical protein